MISHNRKGPCLLYTSGQGAADSAVQAGIGQHQIFLLEAGGHCVGVVVVVGAAGVDLISGLLDNELGLSLIHI